MQASFGDVLLPIDPSVEFLVPLGKIGIDTVVE